MKAFLYKTMQIIAFVCIWISVLAFVVYIDSKDKVIASLGKYEKREFFTSGGFRDYTDYAKYFYTSAKVEENKYFKKVQENDFATIDMHLDDFKKWIKAIKFSDASNELVVNYDFDREIIDTEDYFYIVSEEVTWSNGHTSLERYNIYLFDTQTQVLYYFHNNI